MRRGGLRPGWHVGLRPGWRLGPGRGAGVWGSPVPGVPSGPLAGGRQVLTSSSPETAGGPQEWSLTGAVYERMVTTISRFGHALERRPASARLLLPDEETLRDWLMFLLSTNYEAPDGRELFVGGETVNGNGKTDILIRHQDRNAFIGECKFGHGPKKFGEAIDQLLGYTVWRDTKAAIILFITSRNATAAIDNAGGCLQRHSQCRTAPIPIDPTRCGRSARNIPCSHSRDRPRDQLRRR